VRELIEGRYDDLYRFCRIMLRSQADAEAAVRQILGLALTGEGVESTVDGVALRVCRSWLERRRHVSLPADELGEGDRFASAATESDDARLLAAVARLPLEQRVPLLHRAGGVVDETTSAKLLGVDDRFLENRLQNARLRIAEDVGIAVDEVEKRVADMVAALPALEQGKQAILDQALGEHEGSEVGMTVLTAAIAAVFFVVAVLYFVAGA
jgi:DNA-directed RNA polymerase specialized sigma24 family protein